jgi:hypothetical protein
MSNLSEQNHLDPNDPAYYAPRRLRERSRSPSSLLHEARSEPFQVPLSSSAALDIKLGNVVSDASRHPLTPSIFHEPVAFVRESRRAALVGVGALFVVGALAVVALFFFIMAPGSRQSEAASTPSETTGSIRTALPESRREDGPKPALAEFQAIIAAPPPDENTTHDQSEQLLQRFLQWRQKPNATETSQ